MSGTLRERLMALMEPLLARLGYELVELEFAAGRSHGVLRIFIDQPAGIGVEDCERVSREVSALLDVEDPIPTAYTLEVSSPGFDRVLRTKPHFDRFVGERLGCLVGEQKGQLVDELTEHLGRGRYVPQEPELVPDERVVYLDDGADYHVAYVVYPRNPG